MKKVSVSSLAEGRKEGRHGGVSEKTKMRERGRERRGKERQGIIE